MRDQIIKDLLKNKGREVFTLTQDFHRNAGYAGYFYSGIDASMLTNMMHYSNSSRHGLHIPVWNVNQGKLNPTDFLRLITNDQKFNAKVLGYTDERGVQAIAVERPPFYLTAAQPHIVISWDNGTNPALAGYVPFMKNMPTSVPSAMQNGQLQVIMQNNRVMILTAYQNAVRQLQMERLDEITHKLGDEMVQALDTLAKEIPFDQMPWEELKHHFISNGVAFNESMAKLYAQYRADTTDAKMPTRSEIEAQEELEEALRDKQTDDAHEEKQVDD